MIEMREISLKIKLPVVMVAGGLLLAGFHAAWRDGGLADSGTMGRFTRSVCGV